jgi:hypothetical protein
MMSVWRVEQVWAGGSREVYGLLVNSFRTGSVSLSVSGSNVTCYAYGRCEPPGVLVNCEPFSVWVKCEPFSMGYVFPRVLDLAPWQLQVFGLASCSYFCRQRQPGGQLRCGAGGK